MNFTGRLLCDCSAIRQPAALAPQEQSLSRRSKAAVRICNSTGISARSYKNSKDTAGAVGTLMRDIQNAVAAGSSPTLHLLGIDGIVADRLELGVTFETLETRHAVA